MHCLSFLNLFSFTPNVLKEGIVMRNSFLTLILFLFAFLTGCGDWSNYQPSCNTPTGCSQVADGTTPDNGGGTATTYDCSNFVELATAACNGELLYSECDPETGRNVILCDTDGDGQSDVIVNVTINDDGDVTVEEGDANYSGDSEGDADTDSDSDADSDADSDTDTDTDCEVTAGGIEYCDGVDNDCNGVTDDGDFDADGWISDDCTAYDGTSSQTGDCNDSGAYSGWLHSALIHPGQLELADWIDENCNGYDEDFTTETEVEFDGCMLQCNTDSANPTLEFFETDGDATDLECISAFVMADESGDSNPLDATVSFVYAGTTYTGVGVTCADSTADQGSPAAWDDVDDIKSAMCVLTPALSTADCLALF